jgi:uncharacterized membrane protein
MDVTLYEVLLFAHITLAAVWLGTDATIQAFGLRALAAGPRRSADLLADVEWIGMRILTPSSFGVLAFGVWLVLDQPAWEFSQAWILVGLGVFAASAITGAGFLGPESGRLSSLIAERGVEDPEVGRRIRRILLISRIELVLLVIVVADMVIKPGYP